MGAGAWIQIRDSADHSIPGGRARVTGSRLWVDAIVGGGVALVVQVTESDVVPGTPELVPIAAERDDVLTVLPEADGDWVHLRTTSTGALWVQDTQVLPICDHDSGDPCGTEALMVGGCGEVANGGGATECCVLQMDVACNLKVVDQNAVREGNVVPASPDLFPIAAERDDVLGALAEPDGDWVHLRTTSTGALWVEQATTVALSVANFEGEVAPVGAGSATGIPAFSVRDDDLTQKPAHVANADYIQLHSDAKGALWVREYVPTDHLSGSTNGRPIQITGINTAAAVTIHTATATATEVDKVWCWVTNTSANEVTVTFEFGTPGAANEIHFQVPANDTILAIGGAAIGGAAGQLIEAYAGVINVLNVFGHIERQLTP